MHISYFNHVFGNKKNLMIGLFLLSNNKKIRQPFYNIDGNEINPEKDPYQAIFTFLICDFHANLSWAHFRISSSELFIS